MPTDDSRLFVAAGSALAARRAIVTELARLHANPYDDQATSRLFAAQMAASQQPDHAPRGEVVAREANFETAGADVAAEEAPFGAHRAYQCAPSKE